MKFRAALASVLAVLGLAACSSFNVESSSSGGVYHNSITELSPPKKGGSQPPAEFIGSESDAMGLRAKADYHFTLGETYANEGQSEKAIEEFRHTLVYDPDSSMVHFRLAKEYIRMGLVAEAIEQGESAAKLDPKNVDLKFLLGALYSSMKMYDRAKDQYDLAIAIDPNNADAQLYIGALLAEEGKYDQSVKHFENLAKNKKFNNAHLAWYYIGRIRIQQNTEGSIAQALKALQKCLAIKPEFTDGVLALAGIYQTKGKNNQAIELLANYQDKYGPSANVAEVLAPLYIDAEKYDQAYQQFEIAAESDPDDLNVVLKMAHILFTQKKYDAAITQLERLLARVPDSDKVRYFLAAVYMEKGNYEFAVKNFQQVQATSSLFLQAVVLSAHCYRLMDKKDKAIDILKQALEVRKDVPQFFSSLASVLSENKEYTYALDVIKDGVNRFPNNTDLRFLLGTLYDKIGKTENTLEEMNKVLEINPDHAQALNYIAYTLADQNKNLSQAEAMAKRATELEPEDGYIMDTLGWVQYKQGKVSDAIRTLESAYKLKNDESIIAEHLGDAYFKNQMTQKAREMYKKAAELEKNEEQLAKIKTKILALDNMVEKPRYPASINKKSK